MTEPVFAVVGHPNKGKSSIVSTLAQDDSVRIAPEPGTTVRCRRYPMRVDDQVLYTLVDTPGFQRARRALAWMREHETTADQHAEVVRRFVEVHQKTGDFQDECELLSPIIGGAGILYVVDGSLPYGQEYEAEMEILRWTGQPSMALINPIGQANHVDAWSSALGQYFKVVRVFNAMTAEFDKRLELLRAFGQLNEAWREPLERAVQSLLAERRHRRQRAARTIAEMLAEMVALSVSRSLAKDEDPTPHQAALASKYQDALRAAEQRGRRGVAQIYAHRSMQWREEDLALLDRDLFSQETWFLFGLSRWKLAGTGAAGGAVVGGGVDAALGGATFLVGAALGAAVGGATAWYSAGRLAEFKVLHLPLGGRTLRCGPTSNPNFPYVVLGRARHHHAVVAARTHAQRGEAVADQRMSGPGEAYPLTAEQRRALEAQFRRLRKSPRDGEVMGEAVDAMAPLISELLESDQP